MSNVLKLSELLGLTVKLHEYELAGRTILYGDPTLESLPALAKLGDDEQGGASFANLYAAARTVLRGVDFKGEHRFDEAWFASVPFSDFMHFLRFRQNPTGAGEKPQAGRPFELEVRPGTVVRFAPVTLADVGFFAEYAEQEGTTQVEYMLAQLERVFRSATLEDGSPVPEDLTAKLSLPEVEGLIRYWIGRETGEQKNASRTKATGRRRRAATGPRSSRSSGSTSATASSPETPATSASSPSGS